MLNILYTDCKCLDEENSSEEGNCKQGWCYATQPSTCVDLVNSERHRPKQVTEQPCRTGGTI